MRKAVTPHPACPAGASAECGPRSPPKGARARNIALVAGRHHVLKVSENVETPDPGRGRREKANNLTPNREGAKVCG